MALPVVGFMLLCFIRFMEVLVLVLVSSWFFHYRGGISLFSENKDLIFNVHPILMVIGLVLINGEVQLALMTFECVFPLSGLMLMMFHNRLTVGSLSVFGMLVFRTLPGTKSFRKTVHMSLQLVALSVSGVGLWAALKFHNDKGIDNFYSLHSWLGLSSLLLFAVQWSVGFVTFWYLGGSRTARVRLLPWHVFLGVYIYGLVVSSAVTGVLEKLTFLQVNHVITRFSKEALLGNLLGVSIVVLAGATFLATLSPLPGKSPAVLKGATE